MDYAGIQQKLDYGRGKEAQKLGVPHNVFRMQNPDASGNVLIAGNQIGTAIKAFTKIAYGAGVRDSFEAERVQGILWYQVIADLRPYLVGDIFIVNDPLYGQGFSSVNFSTNQFKGFALADHSPIKTALAGRIDTTVQIYRPTVAVNGSGQWDLTSTGSQPLVLSNGAFSLGTVGAIATKIPAGLVASGKSYGNQAFSQVPGGQRKSGWELYVPALNGFNVHEGDIVIGPDGAKYLVVVPYTQFVGASGSQWFLERQAAGT